MASFARYLRFVTGVAAFFLMITLSIPAIAQQPSQINPTASSVKEQQLLQELNRIQGRVSIPDKRSGVLEQPAGRDWRYFHNVTLRWVGAIAILGMLAVLVIFYLTRGMVRIQGGRSGRTIVRFSGFERFVHWMTATCFIILAISGLNITFGRPLLLPPREENGEESHRYARVIGQPFRQAEFARFVAQELENPGACDCRYREDENRQCRIGRGLAAHVEVFHECLTPYGRRARSPEWLRLQEGQGTTRNIFRAGRGLSRRNDAAGLQR